MNETKLLSRAGEVDSTTVTGNETLGSIHSDASESSSGEWLPSGRFILNVAAVVVVVVVTVPMAWSSFCHYYRSRFPLRRWRKKPINFLHLGRLFVAQKSVMARTDLCGLLNNHLLDENVRENLDVTGSEIVCARRAAAGPEVYID